MVYYGVRISPLLVNNFSVIKWNEVVVYITLPGFSHENSSLLPLALGLHISLDRGY
jgi:hypothetical protein